MQELVKPEFKNSPGQQLPEFIAERMRYLNMRPSWGRLAILSGLTVTTLQRAVKGESNDFGVRKAAKLAAALQVSLDELVKSLNWIE